MANTHTSGGAPGYSMEIDLAVSASTTSGQIGYEQNPELNSGGIAPRNVIVHRCDLLITQASTAACTLDIGTGTTAATSSDNLIDGISVAACPANTVYDNFTDHGTDGRTRQYLAATDFVTVTVASGNANGLQGKVLIDYQLISS